MKPNLRLNSQILMTLQTTSFILMYQFYILYVVFCRSSIWSKTFYTKRWSKWLQSLIIKYSIINWAFTLIDWKEYSWLKHIKIYTLSLCLLSKVYLTILLAKKLSVMYQYRISWSNIFFLDSIISFLQWVDLSNYFFISFQSS